MNLNNIKNNRDLKIVLTVTFIGDKTIKFTLLHICDAVYMCEPNILHIDKWGYTLVKNTYNFQYSKTKFVIPDYIYKGHKHECYFSFRNEKDKYDSLKRLSEMFLGFSKSKIFYDKIKGRNLFKNKIVYHNEFWFVY